MDIKRLLVDKGEKLALGGALAVCAVYFAGTILAGDDEALVPLRAQSRQAESTLAANPAPALKKPEFAPVTSAWSVEAVSKPRGSGEYVAIFKPRIVPHVVSSGPTNVEVAKVPRFPVVPSMSEPESELGQVTLKWTDGKPPEGVPAGVAKEYEVYRQEAGKGWVLLEKVPGSRRSHVDSTVEPRKKYAYKVRLVLVAGEKSSNGKPESEYSQVKNAEIPSGIEIVFEGGAADAAVLKVRKFIGGAWRERKYVVRPEAPETSSGVIGGYEREKNPETGKYEEVDYRTGFVLKAVQAGKFRFTRVERRPRWITGPNGQKHLETEDVEVEAEKDRLQIVFVNDEGKTVEQWAKENDEDGSR